MVSDSKFGESTIFEAEGTKDFTLVVAEAADQEVVAIAKDNDLEPVAQKEEKAGKLRNLEAYQLPSDS